MAPDAILGDKWPYGLLELPVQRRSGGMEGGRGGKDEQEGNRSKLNHGTYYFMEMSFVT